LRAGHWIVGTIPSFMVSTGGVVAILPAGSLSHTRFAAEAANCEGAFLKPTLGWIAGCI
jgi:hypothetical protein